VDGKEEQARDEDESQGGGVEPQDELLKDSQPSG